jgi:hypothetical protein
MSSTQPVSTVFQPLDLDRPLLAIAAFAGLVGVAVGSRFLEIAPNFAGVAAAALLAGVVFRSRAVALGVPLTAMLISDLWLGGYAPLVMLAVYACLAAPALLGRLLGQRPGVARLLTTGVGCSTLFFLVTNFAVWLTGGGIGSGRTLAGLVECYLAAIPFYRMTVLGDLAFIAALFGVRELAGRVWLSRPAVAGT